MGWVKYGVKKFKLSKMVMPLLKNMPLENWTRNWVKVINHVIKYMAKTTHEETCAQRERRITTSRSKYVPKNFGSGSFVSVISASNIDYTRPRFVIMDKLADNPIRGAKADLPHGRLKVQEKKRPQGHPHILYIKANPL